MNIKKLLAFILLHSSIIFIAVTGTGDAIAQTVFLGLGVDEHQPEIPFSGRIDSVAINPGDSDHVLAASNSGGLFESRNRGTSWRHVRELPAMNLRDVLFVPGETGDWILVTAEADFENRTATGPAGTVTTSNGGIWIRRSSDSTWTHPDSAVPLANQSPPPFRTCPPDVSAQGAAYDADTGRVFVATNCGVSYSDDGGFTWTANFVTTEPLSPIARRFYSVAALEGDGVVLAGVSGVWFSDDNGATWARESTGVGRVATFDTHAVGAVRGRSNAAYIVTGSGGGRSLWRTSDMGETWSDIGSLTSAPPGSAGCGGIAHVYAFAGPAMLDTLFYGNSCRSYHIDLLSLGGLWSELDGSHSDTRAIAFEPETNFPVFLASDGGLDRAMGGTALFPEWHPIGSGPGKINALQIYDVAGQAVFGTTEYRLAIGTHDNDLWASSDDGMTWPPTQKASAEGGNIQMRRVIPAGANDKWTYYTCFSCFRKTSDALFQNEEVWAGYTSRQGCQFGFTGKVGDAAPLNGLYIQRVSPEVDDSGNSDCDISAMQFDLTPDYGNGYVRLFTLPDVRGLPVGNLFSSGSTFYHSVTSGTYFKSTTNRIDGGIRPRDTDLLRIVWSLIGPINSAFPAMNGFGSFGYRGFQFEWPAIFGVNPSDPRHIIAPDVQFDRMMVSANGGEDWLEIPLLADRLTRGNQFKFSWARAIFPSVVFSLVSSIEFFPENPELVVLGLHQGGIYISGDRGRNWSFVPGSDQINNVTDFHWKSANEIYVASYGRGLWKISFGISFELDDLSSVLSGNTSDSEFVNEIDFSNPLHLVPRAGQPAPLVQAINDDNAISKVVLAVNGHLSRLSGGKTLMNQIAVTAGSTTLLFDRGKPVPTNTRESQLKIGGFGDITKYLKRAKDFLGPKDGADIVPLGFAVSDRTIVGLVVGKGINYFPPSLDPVQFPPSDPKNPPSYDGAYIVIQNAPTPFSGGIGFTANDTLVLRGHAFGAGSPADIFFDGDQFVTKVLPDQSGVFTTIVPLKGLGVGPHELRVRQDQTQEEDVLSIYIAPSHEQ